MSQQSDYIQRLQQQQLNIQQRYAQQQAQPQQQPQPQQPQQAPHPTPQHPSPQTYQSSNKTTQNITQDVSSTESNTITKEQVKDYLRQWIRVENEISTLTQEIKKRKLIHQQLSSSLMNVMRKNEIDCFDITNGKIVYSKTKTRPPLNKGQLKNALLTYYKDDTESANSLNEFLVASRVEKVKEAIKMKIPK
jgi:uncharacterized protein (UPF0335 family)